MPQIHYVPASAGFPESFLVLVSPDWSGGIPITYGFASNQSEGRTGIESRAPEQAELRLAKIELRFEFDASEADQFRKALAELAGRRIAIPLPVEVSDDPADWVHAPQWRVAWDDSGAAYELLAPGESATLEHVAPLLVGRLTERPKLVPGGQDHATVSLAIVEDAPWSYRISPAYVPGALVDWPFEPDWADIAEFSRDQLRTEQVGQGRELSVSGAEGTPRLGQQARFILEGDEIAQFVGWFAAAQGSVTAFPMPVWYQPGEATPARPTSANFRFADDALKLTYLRPGLASCTVQFWQEVALLAGQPSQAIDPEAILFTFVWDDGSDPVRLTSWEAPITTADGRLFVPEKIEYAELRLTMTQLGDSTEVRIPEDAAVNPLRALRDGEIESTLAVLIERCNPATAPASGVATIFAGSAGKPKIEGNKIVAQCTVFGGVFQRAVPGYLLQVPCNYTVFSEHLCRLSAAAWSTTGTLSGDWAGATLTFTRTGGYSPAGDYASAWFAFGLLEIADADGTLRRRGILASTAAGGGWTLRLNRPLPASCAASVATLRPGCDGRYSTCKGKFANGLNFGGEPFMPEYISTSNGTPQKMGK